MNTKISEKNQLHICVLWRTVKYQYRLLKILSNIADYFIFNVNLGKFKRKCYIVCAKDTHKVLASFFGTSETLKCLMQFLECFYEKI